LLFPGGRIGFAGLEFFVYLRSVVAESSSRTVIDPGLSQGSEFMSRSHCRVRQRRLESGLVSEGPVQPRNVMPGPELPADTWEHPDRPKPQTTMKTDACLVRHGNAGVGWRSHGRRAP